MVGNGPKNFYFWAMIKDPVRGLDLYKVVGNVLCSTGEFDSGPASQRLDEFRPRSGIYTRYQGVDPKTGNRQVHELLLMKCAEVPKAVEQRTRFR